MKIERINDTDYKIYYYEKPINNNTIYDDIKILLKRLQKRLKLNGFYKVIVTNKKIGLFLKLIHIDDVFYKNSLDLKIEINNDNIYYKTEDYFLINNSKEIRYLDEYYYCVVDEDFDEILEKVEFGDFIFEKDIDVNKTHLI